jgi:two-component system, NarL family, response regulator LiaR
VPIRVLVVDDFPVVRAGLKAFLRLDPGIEVVGEAADGLEAVSLAGHLKPDLVLMDLRMPRMDGIAAIKMIGLKSPESKVLVLTGATERDEVIAAMGAGAVGCLPKDTQARALYRAIRAAVADVAVVTTEIAWRRTTMPVSPPAVSVLTDRETEVLELVGVGLANKEIARSLGIGEKTVKTHVSNILAKLRLPSRTHAAVFAVRAGLANDVSEDVA